MKNRSHAFDLLCGICILRMISLHTMGICGSADKDWWVEIMQWSYYFMSFFFFKAGYFNKSVTNQSSKFYCKEKARRLLIPYISAGAIGATIYFAFLPALLHRYHKPVEPLEWSHLWNTSEVWGNIPVWFLFSFFSTYIAIHFLEKLRLWVFDRKSLKSILRYTQVLYIAFPLISYQLFKWENPLWMSLNNVFMGIYLFQLGRLWRKVVSSLSKKNCLLISSALVLVFIAGNIIWHDASYTMSKNLFHGPFLPLIVNITAILCGLSGVLLSLDIPRIPILGYIGEHSMVYFIGHYPMLYYYKFMNLSFGHGIYGQFYHFLILLPAVLMACSWLVPHIEKTPWLSGRWKTEPVKRPATANSNKVEQN